MSGEVLHSFFSLCLSKSKVLTCLDIGSVLVAVAGCGSVAPGVEGPRVFGSEGMLFPNSSHIVTWTMFFNYCNSFSFFTSSIFFSLESYLN